jgi:hypothetical protein
MKTALQPQDQKHQRMSPERREAVLGNDTHRNEDLKARRPNLFRRDAH